LCNKPYDFSMRSTGPALIIAHRGASFDAPENTLPAIRLAWEQEADAVEIDVRMSEDGHIVVIHDADTGRTCGKFTAVNEQSLDQLRRLDAGAWKDPRWENVGIPTLSEVLGSVPAGKRLIVEIKTGAEILPGLRATLRNGAIPRERVVLISFDVDVAKRARILLPECSVFLLYRGYDAPTAASWQAHANELLHTARRLRLDGLDMRDHPYIDEWFVEQASSLGLEVLIYTVNDVRTAARYHSLGIQGITTDRPALLRGSLPRVV
jgi:glycerophosphoryl diester phosphodiesterase